VFNQDILMLIDVHSLLNRAYYGMAGRNRLTAPDGLPTGALFAFMNMLSKYKEEFQPTHVVSAMDVPGETFRHRQYDAYKKGRGPMPDDLARQVPIAKDMLESLGFQPVVGSAWRRARYARFHTDWRPRYTTIGLG
jgi:DNA polymerase-1